MGFIDAGSSSSSHIIFTVSSLVDFPRWWARLESVHRGQSFFRSGVSPKSDSSGLASLLARPDYLHRCIARFICCGG